MRAVCLASGFGSRLYQLTDKTPKPLIKIGNKPIIKRIIEYLHAYNIDEIAINLHYLPIPVIKELQDQTIKFFGEQKPLGTAGALKQMEEWVSDPFICVNGDTLTNVDIRKMILEHNFNNALATVFTHDTLYHNGGVYVFSKKILKYIPKDTNFSIHEDLLPLLSKKKVLLKEYKTDDWYYDIGTKEGLKKAKKYFEKGDENK